MLTMSAQMDWCRIILGFVFSVVVGHFLLWLLIEKVLWPCAEKKQTLAEKRKPIRQKVHLSWLVGVVERLLYTSALIIGAWQWVGIWLALKVIARWQQSPQNDPEIQRAPTILDSSNIWLIGTGLSVLFGFVGAWIALGQIPTLNEKQ